MTVDVCLPSGNGSLLKAAAASDGAAWDVLVERYGALVWSAARSNGNPADAGDAAQLTWLRLIENLDRIVDPDRLGAWLATTARREALRLARRAARERVRPPELFTEVSDRAERPVDARLLEAERARSVHRALARIDPRQRRLLEAFMVTPPPSYATVARELGLPIGSIGPARRRALDRLRRALAAVGMPAAP